MTRMALTSLNEQDCINANQKIMENSGIPTPDGKTTNWSEVKQAYNQNFWYLFAPDSEGWDGVSYETMMNGVVNVTLEPFQNSWVPPIPVN